MTQTKATRLQRLSALVDVPDFVIVARGQQPQLDLDASCRYLVRSSSTSEDQQDYSHAGQLPTLGPLQGGQVTAAVQQAFSNDAVDAVIVQRFIEADEWGVAFCFSAHSMLVEYAAEFEGVTAGLVSPFTAMLPGGIEKYRRLEQQLLKIHRDFGACDVEFVNIAAPRFVQVRPITRSIDFDTEFVKLKMQLQELENGSWRENDLCLVLAERDRQSRALVDLYLQALQQCYATHLNRRISIPRQPFIKISAQYFMAQQLQQQIIPTIREMLRLGFRLPGILREIRQQDVAALSAHELMQQSILLSLAYDLFKSGESLKLRERIRTTLERILPDGVMAADFHYPEPLQNRIEFDRGKATWEHIAVRGKAGIEVVAGDFTAGPYFRLRQRDQAIPEGVIVVTEHLFPEIGASIGNIRGIICKYGALSAHVAILAREYRVPLKIQADISEYE